MRWLTCVLLCAATGATQLSRARARANILHFGRRTADGRERARLQYQYLLIHVFISGPHKTHNAHTTGTYFNSIMFMVASSVVSTILILNYHHRNSDTHEMSEWVSSSCTIQRTYTHFYTRSRFFRSALAHTKTIGGARNLSASRAQHTDGGESTTTTTPINVLDVIPAVVSVDSLSCLSSRQHANAARSRPRRAAAAAQRVTQHHTQPPATDTFYNAGTHTRFNR